MRRGSKEGRVSQLPEIYRPARRYCSICSIINYHKANPETAFQSPRTRGSNSPRNSPHTYGSKHRRGRRDIEAFGGDAEVISDDFDFQAGLANFDKRQIFSEIREGDQTDPDTLLVALNKRRPYSHPLHSQKLGVRENVLDTAPSGDETGYDERESDFEYDALGGKGVDGKKVFFKTISGVPVPAVTPAGMLELDRTACGFILGICDVRVMEH